MIRSLKTPATFAKAFLICCMALGLNGYAARFGLSPATNTLSIKASDTYLTLNWQPLIGKRVLIIASTTSENITLQKETDYSADTKFGSGQHINSGFVVYNGSGTSAKITGLTAGVNYYFSIYESDASDDFVVKPSQTLINNSITYTEKANPNPLTPLTVYTVVCPAVAGITTSLTGTTNSGTSIASAAGCPHVGYADPGAMNPWTSAAGTGTIQWRFSAPVKAATLRMNSVNTNDYGTISASGGAGGAISLSGLVCMGFAGLVVGPLTVAGYGGVYFIPTSTGSYTNITLLNTGAQSGFVGACPTAITTAPLPIELISFTGSCDKSVVILNWKTITEHNNDYFTIERSANGVDWQVAGEIKGAGNSYKINSYEYIDKAARKGFIYYRLKQTDIDKEFKYAPMITVEDCGMPEANVSVFPNPTNNEVNISTSDESAIAEFYTMLGEKSFEQALSRGTTKINITNLPSGVYYIRVSRQDSSTRSFKLVIQK